MPNARLWRASLSIGIVRGVLASVAWYTIEHTGGPLQIPAYAVAMLAWPEAALLVRPRGPTPTSFYFALVVLLAATSALIVASVAIAVHVARRQRGASDQPTSPAH
jgi:hypothetical protein